MPLTNGWSGFGKARLARTTLLTMLSLGLVTSACGRIDLGEDLPGGTDGSNTGQPGSGSGGGNNGGGNNGGGNTGGGNTGGGNTGGGNTGGGNNGGGNTGGGNAGGSQGPAGCTTLALAAPAYWPFEEREAAYAEAFQTDLKSGCSCHTGATAPLLTNSALDDAETWWADYVADAEPWSQGSGAPKGKIWWHHPDYPGTSAVRLGAAQIEALNGILNRIQACNMQNNIDEPATLSDEACANLSANDTVPDGAVCYCPFSLPATTPDFCAEPS